MKNNEFLAISTGSKLDFRSDQKRMIKDVLENKGAKYKLERIVPESIRQRGFYEGAVISLWIFLDGNDWKNSKVHQHYHHEANKEFNGDIIVRNGQTEKIGLSSRGKLGGEDGMIEKVIMFLEEQYAINRGEVLDHEDYKKWRDTVFPYGGAETYIEHLLSLGKLKLPD